MVEVLLIDCHPDSWKDRLPHYLRVLNETGRVSVTVDYRSVGSGFPVPRVDAAVITGSPMMLSEQRPPSGLAEFVRGLSCPVLGICFGHQYLALLTGSAVYRGDKIEGLSPVQVLSQHPLFAGLCRAPEMFESHSEYVKREEVESCGWEVLAVSDSCPVEAMHHRTRTWYGVQFHPERSGRNGAAFMRNFLSSVGRV